MRKSITGFTLIEVSIVLVIIGILTTLVSVQVIRTQMVARDKERENDVKIIAGVLETIRSLGQVDGNVIPSGDPLVTNAGPMGYPSYEWLNMPSKAQSKAILGSIDPEVTKSPYRKPLALVLANDNSGIVGNMGAGKIIAANSSDDKYVYQPLNSDNSLCMYGNGLSYNLASATIDQDVIAPLLADPSSCVKFTIYYFSEATNSIKTLSSRNAAI